MIWTPPPSFLFTLPRPKLTKRRLVALGRFCGRSDLTSQSTWSSRRGVRHFDIALIPPPRTPARNLERFEDGTRNPREPVRRSQGFDGVVSDQAGDVRGQLSAASDVFAEIKHFNPSPAAQNVPNPFRYGNCTACGHLAHASRRSLMILAGARPKPVNFPTPAAASPAAPLMMELQSHIDPVQVKTTTPRLLSRAALYPLHSRRRRRGQTISSSFRMPGARVGFITGLVVCR